MRKLLIICSVFIIFFTMNNTYAGTAAFKVFEGNKSTISVQKVDVTGDSQDEIVILKGMKNEERENFYQQLTLEVYNTQKVLSMKSSLDMEGYDPKLSFGDINGDGAKDILIETKTGGSGGLSNYALVTVNNDILKNLPIPESLAVSGKFKNGYKAEVQVGNEESFVLDLSNRKATYDELGIYQDGELQKDVKVWADSFESFKINDSKLIGTQRVNGIAGNDDILEVVSTWKWENNHWELENLEKKELN